MVDLVEQRKLVVAVRRHLQREDIPIAGIKLAANAIGIRKLELGDKGGRVQFKEKPNVEPATIIRMIQTQPKVYSLDGQDKLKIIMDLPGATERVRAAQELLVTLGARRPD